MPIKMQRLQAERMLMQEVDEKKKISKEGHKF